MVSTNEVEARYTRADAAQTASALLNKWGEDIVEIWLFGSLARSESGHDQDLVVVVPEEMADDFFGVIDVLAGVGDHLETTEGFKLYFSHKDDRRMAADIALSHHELDEEWALSNAEEVDIFLLPSDWRGRLAELQERLPHEDPDFMANIARDALRYDPETHTFVKPE